MSEKYLLSIEEKNQSYFQGVKPLKIETINFNEKSNND